MTSPMDLKASKFLTKGDCGDDGIIITIKYVKQENIAKEGAEPEMKWCIHFEEVEKPMVLNSTNGFLIAKALKLAEDADFNEWKGKAIVLYNDPSVSFGGKITGGIRARAVRETKEHAKDLRELGF